jgi:uncharacterized protein (DUF1800 family)
MIKYLDNNENRKGRPNENLARELMELFTLGEGRGYTENDIKEGARALTGLTFTDNEPRFEASQHDDGTKTILGYTGAFDADGFVNLILALPVHGERRARRLLEGAAGLHRGPGEAVRPAEGRAQARAQGAPG